MCLPADSHPAIYLTPVGRMVTGVSGQRYHVKPNVILVDIKAQDVRAWITAGQARPPSPRELASLAGHLARYE